MNTSSPAPGAPGVRVVAWPRVVNIVLGVWLFLSAFLWPHTHVQLSNTWVLGVLAVIFGIVATFAPRARYLNTVLALWLLISTWAFADVSAATVWSNVIVGVLMLGFSLIPSQPMTDPRLYSRGPTHT